MAKKRSYKGKKQFPQYKSENRFAKNKEKKLKRHLAKHPDDAVAKKCLDKGGFEYSRKNPMVRRWSNLEMRTFIVQHNRNVRGLAEAKLIDNDAKKSMLIADPMVYAAKQAAERAKKEKAKAK